MASAKNIAYFQVIPTKLVRLLRLLCEEFLRFETSSNANISQITKWESSIHINQTPFIHLRVFESGNIT